MTRSETATTVAMIRMMWPHSNLGGQPEEVIVLWHTLLGRFDAGEVECSIRELAASGREHAPLVGQVVKMVTERAGDMPDWDEAWAEVERLISLRGYIRPPLEEHFSHPIIARFAIPAWRELCLGPAPGTKDHGTHYAQQREAFKAMRSRAQRDDGLRAIGAPRIGTLRRVDPAKAAPAQIGSGS